MSKEKQSHNKPKLLRLPLHLLKTEPETYQFRSFEVTEDHVRCLTDALKAGNELDPMTVWKRRDGDYVVVDGHHRHEAYRRIDCVKAIPVRVHECGETEALLLALKDNTKTKLPMTKQERDNAAWRLTCSELKVSKAATVKATGVSDGTIAKMRRTLKTLREQGDEVPHTWWQALQALKRQSQEEWDEDMQRQMIEARAKQLDDAIGPQLGKMGRIQWEAVAIVLERRLNAHTLSYLVDELRSEDVEEDTPF